MHAGPVSVGCSRAAFCSVHDDCAAERPSAECFDRASSSSRPPHAATPGASYWLATSLPRRSRGAPPFSCAVVDPRLAVRRRARRRRRSRWILAAHRGFARPRACVEANASGTPSARCSSLGRAVVEEAAAGVVERVARQHGQVAEIAAAQLPLDVLRRRAGRRRSRAGRRSRSSSACTVTSMPVALAELARRCARASARSACRRPASCVRMAACASAPVRHRAGARASPVVEQRARHADAVLELRRSRRSAAAPGGSSPAIR